MAFRFPELIHPVDPVELAINKLFDHFISCLNRRRVALLTTYRNKHNEISARPIIRARKEEELIGLKTETEVRLQLNELRETQEQLLVVIEQKLEEVMVPQPETQVVFRCNYGDLEQVIGSVGELVEEEVFAAPRYEQMSPIVAVGKKGQTPGDIWNPKGVAIDENTNLIYVVEGEHICRVSIFSDKGEFINNFTHQDMRQPRGIAIHQDNLYVTDIGAHSIFQFKIESAMHFIAKLGSQGFDLGQFNAPRGLTVSTNGDVFVADYGNNRIQILDGSLNYQRSLIDQTMKYPLDVKLTPDEVYVLFFGSACIIVFSHTGDTIRSLITHGIGKQINSADFFCLDTKRNLLISDYMTNEVKIFSKEGTHLHTIGKEGREVGMFHLPKGIILTKNLKLIIVSNNKNCSLQIYFCK